MTQAKSFRIESPAFQNRADMPREYTCEGGNIPPPLQWKNPPAGTQSFVLIVDDPDAPDPKAPQRTWVHWLVYNIPAKSQRLDQKIPAGAQTGLNDFQEAAWGSPCPPRGKHRYFYKLYALDTLLEFDHAPTKGELERTMKGHILGQTELIGLYEKGGVSH
jgi:hypothetical protein